MFGLDHRRLDWETDGRDWPNRDASRFVVRDELRWHVQIMGAETAPTVLLLHGTGASAHSFRGLMPLLSDSYHVVAPDLPGHGFTEMPEERSGLSLWGMAWRIASLLDGLSLSPVIVAGHSAGAAILVHMALSRKVAPRHIVGLNAALEPISGGSLFSPLAKLLFLNPFVPKMFSARARVSDVAGLLLTSTGSEIDETGKRCYSALLQSSAHVAGALGMMANWDLAPVTTQLRHLKIPLTLVVAEDDKTVAADVSRRAAEKAPHSEIVSFRAGGHLLHEVAPGEIARIINDCATKDSTNTKS